MRSGAFLVTDVHATARLISGMINFIFAWYQPSGSLCVEELSTLTSKLALRMVESAGDASR